MTSTITGSADHHAHRRAVLIMLGVTFLWSIAGVFTRHLEAAKSFEVTFWRSFFTIVFMLGALAWQRKNPLKAVIAMGRHGLICGAMWAVMFTCFMLALTMTTTANTLIVNSLYPLFAALLAWTVLKEPIALRTWLAILAALGGMAWMFKSGLGSGLSGTLIAFGIPVAASINIVTLKKAHVAIDLAPAVLLGGLFSAALMLPFAVPFHATAQDMLILAILGFFQLGLPCMLMIKASRHLAPPEMALLSLLEVLMGPLWSWLGAGEVPAGSTLTGGAVVMAALVLNEIAAMRERQRVI